MQKNTNSGSATIEACLTIPIFLFFFLGIASIIMIFYGECHIYQGLAEACGELSVDYYYESAVLSKEQMEKAELQTANWLIMETRLMNLFKKYLEEDYLIESLVKGGVDGITISIKEDEHNKKIFYGEAVYDLYLQIPVLGRFSTRRRITIKQKGFVGYTYGEEEIEEYVYVTPNESVYHDNRNCTHLCLSVSAINSNRIEDYDVCELCKDVEVKDKQAYVSKTTNVCHKDKNCSGLKRTVSRVKKSSIGGLMPCSRCGQ